MNFPLNLVFKVFTFAPTIRVTDANGAEVFFVKQKLFKLRDSINVFADSSQSRQVATINADRMIDWSAKFGIAGENGQLVGGVGRKGMRSLWSAHYEVFNATGAHTGTIREENPGAKIMDGIFSEIPFLGMLNGYFFHPRYLLSDLNGQPVMRLKKMSAFLGGTFQLEQVTPGTPEEDERNILSFLMLVLLERRRG